MIHSLLAKLWPWRRQTWGERYFVWIAAGCALVFVVLSWLIGANQSVWFDEAYSILLAQQPAEQLVRLTALDTHPPFYYLLLKGWATVFGYGEIALRGLSILAAGTTAFVAGLTVRRMFGARIALLVLPFVAMAPFLLRYGFEIRMYALASLIGITATYVLVRALATKPGRDQWMLYGVYATLVALGMYTLYYLAVLWVAHAVWLMWQTWGNRLSLRQWLRQPWVAAFGVSIVMFLPWLPAFISQLGNGALAAISQPMTVDNLIGLVSFEFVYRPAWQLGAVLSLVVVAVIGALVWLTIRVFRLADRDQRRYLALMMGYIVVPIGLITLVSLVRPMYVERYLAHVAIGGVAYVGVIAALAVQNNLPRARWVYGGLLAVMVLGVMQLAAVGNYNFQRLQTPMIKQAAASIPACADDQAVVAADPYVAIELRYYLPDCQVYFYSAEARLKGGYAPLSDSPLRVSDTRKELATNTVLYYVYYDKPVLPMPVSATVQDDREFGALHVRTLRIDIDAQRVLSEPSI